MHIAGVMVGTVTFGLLADYFGRKKILIFAVTFMSITGVCLTFSGSYSIFIILIFLNAFGASGVYPMAFVLGVEMVGRNKRELAGVVLNYFFSFGGALVGLIASLDGDWVHLQLWVSGPPIIFVTFYWIIPESARWLMAKKKKRKAFKIIQKAAKENKAELSQNIRDYFREESDEEDEFKLGNRKNKMEVYAQLLRSKIMMRKILILLFIW